LNERLQISFNIITY